MPHPAIPIVLTAATTTAATNWWNPVGWGAAALVTGIAIGALVVSMFASSDKEAFKEDIAKKEAEIAVLRKQVINVEGRAQAATEALARESIVSRNAIQEKDAAIARMHALEQDRDRALQELAGMENQIRVLVAEVAELKIAVAALQSGAKPSDDLGPLSEAFRL